MSRQTLLFMPEAYTGTPKNKPQMDGCLLGGHDLHRAAPVPLELIRA